MISEAEKLGIKSIITTTHYYKGVYSSDRVLDNFYEVKSRAKDLEIELLLGYEVFLCTALPDIISEKREYTLNSSKYLLFELPFNVMPIAVNSAILKLNSEGLVPIIAHPERNRYFVRDIEKLTNLIETKCLIQVDAASIVGVYGVNVKRFVKKLIKLNLVNFVASDAHSPEAYAQWYLKAFEIVKNWAGEEYTDKIFSYNQNIIINPILN